MSNSKMLADLFLKKIGGPGELVSELLKNKEQARLLATLPLAVLKSAFTNYKPDPSYTFKDPNRAQLHKKCCEPDITWSDMTAIGTVNQYLDELGVPLTPESFEALKNDMEDSKHNFACLFSTSSTHSPKEQIEHLHMNAKNQGEISTTFKNSGEIAGSLLHKGLETFFSRTASVAETLHEQNKQFDEEPPTTFSPFE